MFSYRRMRSGTQAFKGLRPGAETTDSQDREAGSSSVAILITIVFLSILLFAAVNLVQFVMFNIHQYRLQDQLLEPLEKEAMKVIELLYADETPDAESPLDKVWEYIHEKNAAADNAADPDAPLDDDQLADLEEALEEDEDEFFASEEETEDNSKDSNGDDPAGQTPPAAMTVSITLEDISSRIGVNWLDTEFLVKLLRNKELELFKSQDGDVITDYERYAQDFLSYRDKAGLSLHPEETYKDWIKEEAFEKGYFTGYSYFNINITNIFVFQKIYKERIGEIGASSLEERLKKNFENSVRIELLNSGTTETYYDGPKVPLKQVLQGDMDKLLPIITTQPVMNIHLMDREFARQLLLCYFNDSTRVDEFLRHIFNEQDLTLLKEWSLADLRNLLDKRLVHPEITKLKGANANAQGFIICRIFDLLGSYTWFWKLTIKGAGYTDPLTGNTLEPVLTWLIARVPQHDTYKQDIKKLEFKILEKEFTVTKL